MGGIRNSCQLQTPLTQQRAKRLRELKMLPEQVPNARFLRLVVQMDDLGGRDEDFAVFTQAQIQIHVLAREAKFLGVVATDLAKDLGADEIELAADALFEGPDPARHERLAPEVIAVPVLARQR